MDAAALAAAVTAFVAPYLAKAGEKLAEKAIDNLPAQIGQLWGAILARFKGKPAAEEATKDLVGKPEDEDNQAAFRKELRKALDDDAAFAAEVERLLKQAGPGVSVGAGSGAAAAHGGTAIQVKGDVSGGIIVGSGNVSAGTIHTGGSEPDEPAPGGEASERDDKAS